MKGLILNSGLGSRLGELVKNSHKSMLTISESENETIVARQLKQFMNLGITDIVMTTGFNAQILKEYVESLQLPVNVSFVNNDCYSSTNYIYSVYLARDLLDDDLLVMHGDIVCESKILLSMINSNNSSVVVSSTEELPKKDFKAVIENGRVAKIGIEFFDNAMASQPVYFLKKDDLELWLSEINSFSESDDSSKKSCYAEVAFNNVSSQIQLYPFDVKNALCKEIDTYEDLVVVSNQLKAVMNKTVYLSFSTDILHSGHITLINKAAQYGKVIIGLLTDEVVSTYKRLPLLPFEERKMMFENLESVSEVVAQNTLSYKDNLQKYKPDYVVHGDDWKSGFQKPIRDEVVDILASYGGQLVEFPYSVSDKYAQIEQRAKLDLSMPDIRRSRLKKEINLKGLVTAMEAHDGLTGLIVEDTVVYQNGGAHQFDAMWVSSLCDSTAKGKPDIELVDMTSRFRTIDDLMEVTTKPIIFDGDTGGIKEHFVYTVRTLERMGVSMIIVEDKTGLKKNSLFGTEVQQTQDTIENFCEKIKAGKVAQKTADFMICARIESLILERGMEDALTRAFAFSEAGADAIMIHSRKKDPAEIFEFVEKFRAKNKDTFLVVVPTSFNSVTEEEFKQRGVNVVIYANQLMRATVPAIQNAAKMILENHRAQECDSMLMPFKDIIRLIPEK